jgi:NADPH:quinone reductase-like Zn-dependent oxidoreductase
MKSWQLKKGGRESLHLIESPTPQPGAGEILVRTKAVSLNYRDKLVIEDKYPLPLSYPLVPGSDLAGEVVAVGSGVSRFKEGERVVSHFRPKWLHGIPSGEATRESLGGPLPGVLAEYVLLSEQGALAYPGYLTPVEASTLPVAAVTAWVALFTQGNLKPGETVLLQGSGGVSLFALQLAVAHGARVFVTSRSPDKIARLKQLGAAEVIDTSANAAWDEAVLRLTDGRGADHVLDVLGGSSVERAYRLDRHHGSSYRDDFDSECDGQEFANSGRQPRLASRYGRNAGIRRKSSNFTDHRCHIQFPRTARCSRSPRSRSIWQGRRKNQLSGSPAFDPQHSPLIHPFALNQVLRLNALGVTPVCARNTRVM